MIVLGLDPGIARTGYGVVDTSQKKSFISCGCITTPAGIPLEERLYTIASDVTHLIEEYKPRVAVIEEIFFGVNKKTAITTAHVRGVIVYIANLHGLAIQTLTPLQIKSRLTGYGKASKDQIQQMVKRQLHLHSVPQPDDAADALAAALCAQ